MYYLTKILLTPEILRNEQIKDAYSVHRFVYSLFPLNGIPRGRILYADKGAFSGKRLLLVLSEKEPSFPTGVHSSSTVISESFLQFSDYRFEVELNPVRKCKEDGKRHAVIGQLDLLNWFIDHTKQWGFQAETAHLEVFPRQARKFTRKEESLLFNRALFRGQLHVTDPKAFQNALFNGLGHGKAFGFGLLQLMPIQNFSKTETIN